MIKCNEPCEVKIQYIYRPNGVVVSDCSTYVSYFTGDISSNWWISSEFGDVVVLNGLVCVTVAGLGVAEAIPIPGATSAARPTETPASHMTLPVHVSAPGVGVAPARTATSVSSTLFLLLLRQRARIQIIVF